MTFNITSKHYTSDKNEVGKVHKKTTVLNLKYIVFFPDNKTVLFYTDNKNVSWMPLNSNTFMAVSKKVGKILRQKYVVLDA